MGKQFNVLIVGAGNIGAFFDTAVSENILTHAHAFVRVEGFNLLGFVDISSQKSQEASKLWNVNYFLNIEQAFNKNSIDIVSVCVPDDYHYDILKKLSQFPIKLVFTEKPFTKTLEQADEIIRIYNRKNIKCLINYSRRFVRQFISLKNKISSNKYGAYICGSGYYGKGILHNGSHMIDLLRYLIGEIEDTRVLNYNFDFYKNDPSISSVLTFKNGKNFVMQNVPCDEYTIFELELLFQDKKIRIIDSGFTIEEYTVGNNIIFKGYKSLIEDRKYDTELGKAMENAVINIYNNLLYNEDLNCTMEDGYKVMGICDRLKEEVVYE